MPVELSLYKERARAFRVFVAQVPRSSWLPVIAVTRRTLCL